MNIKFLVILSVASFLVGCGDSMYEKCVRAETTKLNELKMQERLNKYNEYYTSPYNIEIAGLFEKASEATTNEADDVYQFTLENLYTDEYRKIQTSIEAHRKHPELIALSAATEAWLEDRIDYEAYKQEEEKCQKTPECAVASSKLEELLDEKQKVFEKFNDLKEGKFTSEELFSQLSEKVEELIKTYTYQDIALLLSGAETETAIALKLQLAGHNASDKITVTNRLDLLEYFLAWDVEPEGYDRDEPYPYIKNNKLWAEFEGSGDLFKVIEQRLAVFITEPDFRDAIIQICNERGLYE